MQISPAIEVELIEQAVAAMRGLGLDVADVSRLPKSGREDGVDAIATVNGRPIAIEVKAVVTEHDAGRFVGIAEQLGATLVIASRRIAEGARRQLREAGVGYFDGRGHLRLALPPGVLIDADTDPGLGPGRSSLPFEGEVVKEVAIVLLTEPTSRLGPRAIARITSRSPGAVAGALGRLRENGLVTSKDEPAIPDLFWALAGVWRRRPTPMAKLPMPGDRRTTDLLQLGLDETEFEGWALTDSVAAQAWGMPIVLNSGYPPDFYVPSIIAFQRAQHFLGVADDARARACTVAIAPVPLVCRWRNDLPSETWKVANHVVVALDLATDPSRGAEILERWNTPEGLTRVW